MRGRAIARFLEDLVAGDPVALTFVGVFAVIGAVFGVFMLVIRRNQRREDEERARRYGRKKWNLLDDPSGWSTASRTADSRVLTLRAKCRTDERHARRAATVQVNKAGRRSESRAG
jgi:hypothetical protein